MANVEYRFHGAGHGLFASGTIVDTSNSFHWVFDCGKLNNQAPLTTSIDQYFTNNNTSNTIDLLCLSHFDHDHISGIEHLLRQGRSVHSIVIPHFSKTERILIASRYIKNIKTLNSLSGRLLAFYLEPITYLQNLVKNKGVQIYIMYGENSTEDDVKKEYDDKITSNIVFVKSGDAGSGQITSNIRQRFQNLIPLLSSWEFIFMHHYQNRQQPFEDEINALIGSGTLLNYIQNGTVSNPSPISVNLQNLKDIYKGYYNQASMNTHGLSMYAGPTNSGSKSINIDGSMQGDNSPSRPVLTRNTCSNDISIYYAGDTNLWDSNTHSTNVINGIDVIPHFTQARWRNVGIIQVPHHGSYRSNFTLSRQTNFTGLLPNLKWSVFTASGNSNHPHNNVWGVYAPYHPILVNSSAAIWHGTF